MEGKEGKEKRGGGEKVKGRREERKEEQKADRLEAAGLTLDSSRGCVLYFAHLDRATSWFLCDPTQQSTHKCAQQPKQKSRSTLKLAECPSHD